MSPAFLPIPPIVGYATKDIEKNTYVLTGVQFESMDGQNNAADLLSTTDAGTTAWNGDDNVEGWYNNALTLMIPNGKGGYNYFYYAADGYNEADDSESKGWCDKFGYLQTGMTLTTGLGVWFKGSAADNGSITVSGQVLAEDSTTTEVGAGYTIIANPYPIAADIQDVATSASAATAWNGDDTIDGWYNSAPTIMIPNGKGGYNYFYYAADGYDESNDSEYAGWCDKFGYIQKNVTIPVSTGVWFKNDTATTVTFAK